MNEVRTNQFSGLTSREREAVQAFLQRLHHAHGNLIRKTILFGSKARGDSEPESDIDILIIVAEESWALRDDISRIAAQESLAYDVLIGPRVIGLDRWSRMASDRFALYENISREGLTLTLP
jgi:predicted nucleotidyltransferase